MRKIERKGREISYYMNVIVNRETERKRKRK
jgi:hypothetical protein